MICLTLGESPEDLFFAKLFKKTGNLIYRETLCVTYISSDSYLLVVFFRMDAITSIKYESVRFWVCYIDFH